MSHDDHIDEVALNVLLAEGVDFPTALEASRVPADLEGDEQVSIPSSTSSKDTLGYIAFVAVALVMLALWAIF